MILFFVCTISGLNFAHAQEVTVEASVEENQAEEATVVPSATPTVVPSATLTVVPSATPTDVPSATPTDVPSITPTVELSATPTVELSATPTVELSATPTVELSATPTVELSATPTVELSATPTVELSATPSPTSEINFGMAMENQMRIQSGVVQALQDQERVRVIVNFVEPVGAQSAGATQRKQMLSTQRSNMLNTMNATESDLRIYQDYDHISAIAAEITQQGALALLNNPLVESVQIDGIVRKTLNTARTQIEVPTVEGWGYNGSGVNVAVLDTGIQASHTALSDDVVAQKCFDLEGNCPGGGTESNNAADGDGHGTHVSGIITSRNSTYTGIATGSGIAAVKILNDQGYGYDSDILKGLNWVYTNRNTYNIRIVNMSLGTSIQRNTACDASYPSYLSIANQLNSVGVYIVAASGNDGYRSGIGSPACVSSIISVGSVTYSDAVSYFSNVGAILDVFAPGSSICSSIPTNRYGCWSGTSMATPVVAGVVALMLDADSTLSFTEVRNKLKTTGPVISVAGYNIRRVDASESVGSPPGSVTMQAVSALTTLRPFANWTLTGDATRATSFEIIFRDGVTNNVVSRREFNRVLLCGSSQGTTCSVRVDENLIPGRNYIITVRGENEIGYSDWAYQGFTMLDLRPDPVTMGNATWLGTPRPFANWTLTGDATRATSFDVIFLDVLSRQIVSRQTVSRVTACGSSSGTTCRVRVDTNLTPSRRYYIIISSSNYYGDSSASWGSLTMPDLKPDAVTMGNATWLGTSRPFANWTLTGDATRATSFDVIINDTVLRRTVSNQTVTRATACGSVWGTTCRVRVDRNLVSGRRYLVIIRGRNTYGTSTAAWGSMTPY
jgi:subtilisin family serine protease/ferredoxin